MYNTQAAMVKSIWIVFIVLSRVFASFQMIIHKQMFCVSYSSILASDEPHEEELAFRNVYKSQLLLLERSLLVD